MSKGRLPQVNELQTQEVIWAVLYHELARVQRYNVPLSVLRLKAVSPQPGKLQAADAVKQVVGQVLKTNSRQADMAGMYQNDYLVILPLTEEAGAALVAQRLVGALYTSHPPRYGKTLQITPFIGLTATPGGAAVAIEDLVRQATEALREAFRRTPGSVVSYAEAAASAA